MRSQGGRHESICSTSSILYVECDSVEFINVHAGKKHCHQELPCGHAEAKAVNLSDPWALGKAGATLEVVSVYCTLNLSYMSMVVDFFQECQSLACGSVSGRYCLKPRLEIRMIQTNRANSPGVFRKSLTLFAVKGKHRLGQQLAIRSPHTALCS